jgi:hypothetical protein
VVTNNSQPSSNLRNYCSGYPPNRLGSSTEFTLHLSEGNTTDVANLEIQLSDALKKAECDGYTNCLHGTQPDVMFSVTGDVATQ